MGKYKLSVIFSILTLISIFPASFTACQYGFSSFLPEESKKPQDSGIEATTASAKSLKSDISNELEEKAEESIMETGISSTEKTKNAITLISVYDNYQVNPELKTDWGFGCFIKTAKDNILFDTGGNKEILLFNMKKMGIEPESVDKVFISHIHGDHAGALAGFLNENSEVTVYIPDSFPDSVRDMIESSGADFKDVSHPLKISDSVWSTGTLYGPPDEQSLVINSSKGLVIITGCAHPGIVKIVKKAKEMFPQDNIYLVLGGFHHPPSQAVWELKKIGVEKVAPSHCSGDDTRKIFEEEFKDDFIANGVGKVINID